MYTGPFRRAFMKIHFEYDETTGTGPDSLFPSG